MVLNIKAKRKVSEIISWVVYLALNDKESDILL